jgi:hypothetical protein
VTARSPWTIGSPTSPTPSTSRRLPRTSVASSAEVTTTGGLPYPLGAHRQTGTSGMAAIDSAKRSGPTSSSLSSPARKRS